MSYITSILPFKILQLSISGFWLVWSLLYDEKLGTHWMVTNLSGCTLPPALWHGMAKK